MSPSEQDRLFALLPQFVRAADERQPSQPLRTLYRILQLAYDHVERDVAGLYDDWFIETCAGRTVPHIGALVGADLGAVPALWSHRAQVANILRWRGSPGTLATLAQAAASASGWPTATLDLGTAVAMSAAIGPAPGPPAVARIPRAGADGPGDRPRRSASVTPVPPRRGRTTGSAYVMPNAVSLSVFTLPVFFVEGVEPGRCGAVFSFHPDGLTGPLYVAPDVFAPARADPQGGDLPRPLTRALLRTMAAGPRPKLPFAIRRHRGDAWVAVPADRIGVTRLDGTKHPPTEGAEVLVDPERGLFAFAGRSAQPGTADLRVDYGFGFGGPVGAGAWSAPADVEPTAPVRRICLAAPRGAKSAFGPDRSGEWARSLDEAMADWDGTTDLDLRIVDGGRYAVPSTMPKLGLGVVLSISAAPGARPGLRGALSVDGDRARLVLEGLDLPDGVSVRGASLVLRGSTVGLARPRAVHVDCGWASGRLEIVDSIVGPVVCEAARLKAKRSIFDARPAPDAAPDTAIGGDGGASPASVRLDRCTVLGDLNLAREATLTGCALDGTLHDGDGIRRLRARFITRKLNDPYYLQLLSDGGAGAEDGAFGSQDRAHRLQALDSAIERYLPQGLACAVVLAS